MRRCRPHISKGVKAVVWFISGRASGSANLFFVKCAKCTFAGFSGWHKVGIPTFCTKKATSRLRCAL